ncbi:GNAT family N-acetyltransferase (plasmid) [Priestia megaterium]|uniref:Acetyltransferase family protein n=3 Tax=Priestia megaterium TaxID=1404 RepID=A0A0B6AXM0_PRIM2|nr:GNAT family protein [Priestia megaterium]MCL9638413.1 GNAT family N-acetyltransferase [Bacillus zanthoxyli]AJI25827.1 acetyltransferase family protein [Priestia megaterium NBRC 15308 = ATCC 14581]KFN08123.1 acetyltransferase family protein [Priestia megaterium]KGJ80495.1 ribosomal protein N-acetylase [Priestia megaterium NBRC 15308 = ATCC 14581]MED4399446.1 GNAT family protein [Priestia megaterium]
MMNSLFSQNIKLENSRVSIVPFEEQYREGLKDIIFDESIWSYMGMVVETDQDLKNYINSTLLERNEGKSYPFIIIDKKTNCVAGSTRLGNINFHNKRLEIGWTWYGKEFQGTGLNHACKYELLKYIFEEMKFNRVQLSADIDNIRSQKAILKLGAKQEGIFRNNYIDQNGNKRDDVYFSIISDEWINVKEKNFVDFNFYR